MVSYAFQLQDLTVLLGLELGEADDHADIDDINKTHSRLQYRL
jgi:hypothetical protein